MLKKRFVGPIRLRSYAIPLTVLICNHEVKWIFLW